MGLKPLKVSEVNQYVKRILATDPILYNIKVEGEISNFKHHYSGHMYFTLKDEKSRLKCVMFNSDNHKINFRPEDGMKVILTGYISVYEKNGSYQFYVREMEAKGLGELFIKFEELKKKLQEEGLFDTKIKKNLPLMPKKIGVVTSSTGAAIRDIISTIKRRMPLTSIIIYPVHVQGERAHKEICKGLKYLDSREDIDIIITGRGGGSIEELWAFNEEDVARTIYKSNTPIISAVGHETDFTIADFVADLRAPTPSGAGEMVVQVSEELKSRINDYLYKLENTYKNLLKYKRSELENLKSKVVYNNPVQVLNKNKLKLNNLLLRLTKDLQSNNNKLTGELETLGSKLNALSPLSVLDRGYSIVTKENGLILKSTSDIQVSDTLNILLKDGNIRVSVDDIKPSEERYYEKP